MARITYTVPNPADAITFQKIRIERAADAGGAPGAFAQIVEIDADTSNELITYLDTTGSTTSWYRHRYANTSGSTLGDYSTSIQFGDYSIRQRIKLDIPDTDITNTLWDNWRDGTIQDMVGEGLGRQMPAQTVSPSSFNTTDYAIDIAIRRVIRVEIWNSSTFISGVSNWYQWGRTLRIFRPSTGLTYKVYGIGEMNCLSDMDDELHEILYWGMRGKYLDFRIRERTDFRPYLARTRTSDTTTAAELLRLKADSDAQFDQRVTNMRQSLAGPAGGGTV